MAVEVVHGDAVAARRCGSIVCRDDSGAGGDPRLVTELRTSAFLTASASQALEALAAQTPLPTREGHSAKPGTYNSTHRYIFELATLGGILKQEARWQVPMIAVSRSGALRPLLSLEDFSAAPGAKCVAIATKNPTDRIKNLNDVPEFLHVMTLMDRDVKFQEAASEFASKRRPMLMRADGQAMVRYRVMCATLFDAPSYSAFQSVPQMLRPGVDRLEVRSRLCKITCVSLKLGPF